MSSSHDLQLVDDPDDPDLDLLLDDALADFGKSPSSVAPKQNTNPPASKLSHNTHVETESQPDTSAESRSLDDVYGELQKAVMEAMQSGSDARADSVGVSEEMSSMVQQLTDELARIDVENSDDPLAQTLSDLSKTLASDAERSSESCDPAAEMLRRLGGLGAGGGSTDGEDSGVDSLLQFTQSVMVSVLSKSVLYGPLKEVSGRYPAWLASNAHRLEADELQRYRQQLQLMQQVCAVFEEEQESSGESGEPQRRQRVFELMQKMQALGQPPAELVGDSQVDWKLDDEGNPQLPSLPPGECSLM